MNKRRIKSGEDANINKMQYICIPSTKRQSISSSYQRMQNLFKYCLQWINMVFLYNLCKYTVHNHLSDVPFNTEDTNQIVVLEKYSAIKKNSLRIKFYNRSFLNAYLVVYLLSKIRLNTG